MSGALPINIGQGAVRSIYRNTCPTPIAPVTVQSILWTNAIGSTGGLVSFNFQSIIPQTIAGIQGAFIDNSACVLPVTITDCLGNEFVIPAGWQAMIPIAYTQGGTVSAQIPGPIQELTNGANPQPPAMTTNIEFYNEQVENVGMWPVAKPAGICESANNYALGQTISDGTIDTFMHCTLGFNEASTMTFGINNALPFMVEEIIGGAILPTTAQTQGTTGFYGSLVLYSALPGTAAPTGLNHAGLMIPINIPPSAPVEAIDVPDIKFRLVNDLNNLLGAGYYEIQATVTDNIDSNLFPNMEAHFDIRVRYL